MNNLPYRPCVGMCLIEKNGLIFSGKRIDMPSNAWQMPQGGVDEGEEPNMAALRELKEETGVNADKVTLIQSTKTWLRYDLPDELIGRFWSGKYRGQRQRWFLYRFEGKDGDVDIRTEHPEFSQWAWKSADELIDAIVPFKRSIYKEVFREFSSYLA